MRPGGHNGRRVRPLEGDSTLNMSGCCQAGITDAAFVNLKGNRSLRMWGCRQGGITDAAFVNLTGIHSLFMEGCRMTPALCNRLRATVPILNM